MNELSVVSVIVPCRNEKRFIERCLDSVVAQDYSKDKLQVLVIDGLSKDGTREVIKKYSERFSFVRLLDNPKKITPVAINIGIKEARGEIIIRMNAHSTYQKDHISKCVKYLKEYRADNVGGRIITVPRDNTFIGGPITLALSHQFGVGSSYFRTGSQGRRWVDTVFGECCKKEIFDKIGVFNEKLSRGQDMEFSLRLKKAGYRTLLVPEITAYYYAPSDLKSFIKHSFINGLWVILPFRNTNIMPVSFRHLVPLAFVLSLIGSGILSFFFLFFKYIFLAIILLYCSVNVYFSAKIALEKKDFRYLFLMPVVFTALHIGYGLGSGVGVIKLLLPEEERRVIMSKRLFDIIFSFIGLAALFPLIAVIALLIKRDSSGPVFYRGLRIGKFGKPFRIYKFRTMVVDADKIGGPSTADDDARITKLGRILRKYKLDELPQLINILKGEMSFVGPRPEVPQYVNMFTEQERAILSVKPGITDWASLWNSDEGAILAGSPDPEKTYMEKIRPEKIRLQLKYVRERSFGADLRIIFDTLWTIMGNRRGGKGIR